MVNQLINEANGKIDLDPKFQSTPKNKNG